MLLTEYSVLAIVSVMALAIAFKYAQANKKVYLDSPGPNLNIEKLVKQCKQSAQYIVIGRIKNIQETLEHSRKINTIQQGKLIYELDIEKVEKGMYFEDTMNVVVGLFSNLAPQAQQSPFLKKEYRTGDRVRVYVNYDPKEQAFYSPGSWYTIALVN